MSAFTAIDGSPVSRSLPIPLIVYLTPFLDPSLLLPTHPPLPLFLFSLGFPDAVPGLFLVPLRPLALPIMPPLNLFLVLTGGTAALYHSVTRSLPLI